VTQKFFKGGGNIKLIKNRGAKGNIKQKCKGKYKTEASEQASRAKKRLEKTKEKRKKKKKKTILACRHPMSEGE